MRILVVEDDLRIAKPLAEDLRHQQHIVDLAEDGVRGWEYARSQVYDLMLLDVMLPRLDGIELCRRLRQDGCTAQILMLTARDTIADKVVGLDAGADDYLVKPFDLDELAARIRALSRRSPEIRSSILTYGDLHVNPATCQVFYGNTPFSLTPKEYVILDYFLRHPQEVITKSVLIDKLWEFDRLSGEETVKTHLTNLRRKLKDLGYKINPIETIYGMGYRLRVLT
ncbi:response regulator transcription factor [Chamaesiphon sp. GL140_3_metabinner_50]|uniref:response regulator transcription factor n=1 Tax=Chamaesiphon sp. GL140_3_metabinner_50 TaxID=2970812 RepID=UPI0025FB0D97|nr:response regulator transcription factor [Chamaesiphon sp. GL140_3_metabinner_50]